MSRSSSPATSRWFEASLAYAGPLARGLNLLGERAWSSWEDPPRVQLSEESLLGDVQLLHAFWETLEALSKRRPQLRVFWKDRSSVFLGASLAFAADAGLDLDALVGRIDTDAEIAWSRQGAKFRRDDEAVMGSAQPRLNILERQDERGTGTRWLVTSKVPLVDGDEVVGILGAYDIVSRSEALAVSRRHAKTAGRSGEGE
ncbi:MAG: PAS domain-containing protein [Myxococcota bacterium]